MDLPTRAELDQLLVFGKQCGWTSAFIVLGWIHLLTFGLCHYVTSHLGYPAGNSYFVLWALELIGVAITFRVFGGPRPKVTPPLEHVMRRIWIGYFFLAFDLVFLNSLRGHGTFELFPAIGALASLAFMAMAALFGRVFLVAALVMFVSGLLMAAHLDRAFLIFGVAWWIVLQAIGIIFELKVRARAAGLQAQPANA